MKAPGNSDLSLPLIPSMILWSIVCGTSEFLHLRGVAHTTRKRTFPEPFLIPMGALAADGRP